MVKGWEERALLSCVDILQGLTYRPDNVKPYGLLVLRSSNIKNGNLIFNDCVYVDCRVDPSRYIKPKDILICVRNGSSSLIGKSCVIDQTYNATFGAFMSVLRGDETGYIAHVFSSEIVQVQIRNRSNATINQITKRDFENIIISLPDDPKEQHAIAAALSDADAYIDALEKLIAKKRSIKQGAMQELLTGKRRLPGFSGEWVEKPLGEIALNMQMGQSPDSLYYNDAAKGLPLIQGNADMDNRLTLVRTYTTQITKFVPKGSILLTVRAPVGNVAKASFDCCAGRGVCSFTFQNELLYQLLLHKEPFWTTLSKGSTFDSINGNELRAVSFYITIDEKEQSAIATALSDMDAEIDGLMAKLNKAKQVKQGMMNELLTGRIRLL